MGAMGTPIIWMLGLAPRWTIFEFSKYSNIGNSADIPLTELQLPWRKYLPPNFNSFGPTLLSQVFRGGHQGAQGENSPWPSFCMRGGQPRYLKSAQPNFLRNARPLFQKEAFGQFYRDTHNHFCKDTPDHLCKRKRSVIFSKGSAQP